MWVLAKWRKNQRPLSGLCLPRSGKVDINIRESAGWKRPPPARVFRLLGRSQKLAKLSL